MKIEFQSTYNDAVAHTHCAACLRAKGVIKQRSHVCVRFEGRPSAGRLLTMRTMLLCDWCYLHMLSEYVDFGVYDWQNIFIKFKNNGAQYRFDSRFRCNG